MPRTPEALLTSAELEECARATPRWQALVAGLERPFPVVLSYTTRVPSAPWYLGLSASLHSLPLAIAGLGAPRWPWYEGGSQVITGTRRAAHLLHHLLPTGAVVAADSGDTIIANAPRHDSSAAAALRRVLDEQVPRVLIGAECRSWPKCYRELFANVSAHQECWKRSASCYANGGMALGATRSFMMWAEEMARMFFSYRTLPMRSPLIGNTERTNNQAILHRLLANHSALAFDASLDDANEFFVSLNSCEFNMTGTVAGPFRFCSERAFHPLSQIRTGNNSRRGTHAEEHGVWFGDQLPFLLHANSAHSKLLEPVLEPLLARVREPRDVWLDRPVLLLDAMGWGANDGSTAPCTETTLGALLASAKAKE